MSEKPSPVTSFNLRPADLEARIHELATVSARVAVSRHAIERMIERGITDRMMFVTLRGGRLVGSVEPGKRSGEWKCKMVMEMRGRREMGVVTLVIGAERLLVKTVEWEDVR